MDLDLFDFTDAKQRDRYFALKLEAELTEIDQKEASRYQLFDEEQSLLDALITARLQAGLTQAELADKIDRDRMTISRVEATKHSPSLRLLLDIADVLGLDIALLPKPSRLSPIE
jgi:DNA-binding XRE family transcriptional regulator